MSLKNREPIIIPTFIGYPLGMLIKNYIFAILLAPVILICATFITVTYINLAVDNIVLFQTFLVFISPFVKIDGSFNNADFLLIFSELVLIFTVFELIFKFLIKLIFGKELNLNHKLLIPGVITLLFLIAIASAYSPTAGNGSRDISQILTLFAFLLIALILYKLYSTVINFLYHPEKYAKYFKKSEDTPNLPISN